MPVLKLTTYIEAPIVIVFDLSRSIDLHLISASHTKEKAVNGKTSGLMKMDDIVTWKAVHFGILQYLTVKITDYNKPFYFADEMVKGAFKAMRHEHYFEEDESGTTMTDVFMYKSPFGIFGRFADMLFLKKYMYKFLQKRNKAIKEIAVSPEKYKKILPDRIIQQDLKI